MEKHKGKTMDFNEFDSVTRANEGAWMVVLSPADGNPIYARDPQTGEIDTTKPARVKVLGAEGDVAQQMVNSERAKLQGSEPENGQKKIQDQASRLIVGFENINRGDRPARAPDDNDWFVGLQKVIQRPGVHPSFAEQVRDFSLTRMFELGNAPRG